MLLTFLEFSIVFVLAGDMLSCSVDEIVFELALVVLCPVPLVPALACLDSFFEMPHEIGHFVVDLCALAMRQVVIPASFISYLLVRQ